MNNKIILLVTVVFVIISSGTGFSNVSSDIPGIIFSKNMTNTFASKFPDELRPPYWTPTINQIVLLEKSIHTYIKEHTPKHRKPIYDLSKYKRQYLGITSEGKKIIYINVFCKEHWSRTEKWHSDFVFVFGGGNCYFQLHYDPGINKFSNYEINSKR